MSTHAGHRRVPLVPIRYRCEAIVTTPERLGCPSVSNPTCVLAAAPDTLTALRTRLCANPAHGAGPRLVSVAGCRSQNGVSPGHADCVADRLECKSRTRRGSAP